MPRRLPNDAGLAPIHEGGEGLIFLVEHSQSFLRDHALSLHAITVPKIVQLILRQSLGPRCQRYQVTMICRLRLDAALYHPPGPQAPGKRGPKPKKGPRPAV